MLFLLKNFLMIFLAITLGKSFVLTLILINPLTLSTGVSSLKGRRIKDFLKIFWDEFMLALKMFIYLFV